MEWVEQNISGVKLEKLRKDAEKKTRIMKRIFPAGFGVLAVLSLASSFPLLHRFQAYGWSDPVTQGGFWILVGKLMMSVILSGDAFLIYYMMVWKKAYERFNFSFKNKYVLDTIRSLPGFSHLDYKAQSGITYQEMDRMNLIPKGGEAFFEATDELTGELDGVRFCTSNVRTGRRPSGRSSMPKILFEGQILMFDTFDERKISRGFVQVFSKKALPDVKRTAAPLQIQTENALFNENFVVFAEQEENAFYILTPRVLEQITAFQEAMEGKVYLSFCESRLYVTCSQFRNPFDARIDLPIPVQCQQIAADTRILRSAREILVQASEGKEREEI